MPERVAHRRISHAVTVTRSCGPWPTALPRPPSTTQKSVRNARGRSAGELDTVSHAHRAGLRHTRVHASQAKGPAFRGAHELESLFAEPSGELPTTRMRLSGDFDLGLADPQARARGQVLLADVEVDVQLVARERPP